MIIAIFMIYGFIGYTFKISYSGIAFSLGVTDFFFVNSLNRSSLSNIAKIFSDIIMQAANSSVNCGLKENPNFVKINKLIFFTGNSEIFWSHYKLIFSNIKYILTIMLLQIYKKNELIFIVISNWRNFFIVILNFTNI